MSRLLTRIALGLSGTVLASIGGALLVSPADFLAMSHVFIENDPGLLSELTAPSGVLILTGMLMIAGALKQRLANLALLTGAIVYGSYGLGRLISMVLHGLPSESLIIATVIEFAVAAALVALRLTSPT
ncbi:DUF4345 domain-containing protein [Maricaulaceae bacterium EIL42A08]|nr:DUF4345 domain-containing protein [Maricaulaceae bacterium EIL42A08]